MVKNIENQKLNVLYLKEENALNVTYRTPIERNEAIVKEMKERAKLGFKYGDRVPYLNEIAEKYNISYGNAQQLYYTRVRGKEDEETEDTSKQWELAMDAKMLENVVINQEEVRVVEYENGLYVVAKDLLLSIGIKSSSSYLNELLVEEDKVITPIPSTHGLAKTLIISIDTAIAFLEIVSVQHQSLKIQSSAKVGIPILQQIRTGSFAEQETTNQSFDEAGSSIQTFNHQKMYQPGESVMVRVVQIGEKTVETETIDEEKTRGTIYIADVADVYVSNLHDFFEAGETIEATVKGYDERVKRLSLTTLENPYMKLRSKFKTSTHRREWEQPRRNEEEIPQSINQEMQQDLVQEVKTESNAPQTFSYSSEQEIQKIMEYLQNEVKLSFISEQAQKKLAYLLQNNSLFDLSVAMVKLSENFQPDVSVLFMNQLEASLKKD